MLINLDVELVELSFFLLALTKVATLTDKWDMKMDAILVAMSAEMPITRFTTCYIKSYSVTIKNIAYQTMGYVMNIALIVTSAI